MYVYIYIRRYVCMYEYINVYICMCECVYMHVCMYECMYVLDDLGTSSNTICAYINVMHASWEPQECIWSVFLASQWHAERCRGPHLHLKQHEKS